MSLRPLINRKLHWAKIQNVPVEGERVTGKRCRGRMDSLCWLCVCVCVPARVCVRVCVCIFLPGCVWQEPGLIAVKAREWERRKKEADACVLAQKKIRPLSASHTHTHSYNSICSVHRRSSTWKSSSIVSMIEKYSTDRQHSGPQGHRAN